MLGNIEAERTRVKISQEQLAAIMGCSVKTYYNWIHERTDIPSSALKKMKELFKAKSIDYLLEHTK